MAPRKKKLPKGGSEAILNALQFVKPSLAKKDIVEANTHFVIGGGRIRAFNGSVCMCAPVPLEIDCKPKGIPFMKALDSCATTANMSLTPAGKLRLTDGKFKALIECTDSEVGDLEPEGDYVEYDGEQLVEGLRQIMPVVGTDASRQWTNGVLLSGHSLYATCNTIIVEKHLENFFPYKINVDRKAVEQIIKQKDYPIGFSCTGASITFFYSDNRWIRVALIDPEWPATMHEVLNKPSEQAPVDPAIFEAIMLVKPFTDKLGRIFFDNGMVKTHLFDEDEGSSVEVEGLPANGIYQAKMLELVENMITTIDWNGYPGACMFYGDRLRGALIGMKQ